MILYILLGLIALITGLCFYYRKPIFSWIKKNKVKMTAIVATSAILGAGGLILLDDTPPIPSDETFVLFNRGPFNNEYYNTTTGKHTNYFYTNYVNYQNADDVGKGSWSFPINTTFILDGVTDELVMNQSLYTIVVAANRSWYRIYPDRNNETAWIDFYMPDIQVPEPPAGFPALVPGFEGDPTDFFGAKDPTITDNEIEWEYNNFSININSGASNALFVYKLNNSDAQSYLNMTFYTNNLTLNENGTIDEFPNITLRNNIWDSNTTLLYYPNFDYDFNSTNNYLNISIPQDELDNCTYPIYIDPTIEVDSDVADGRMTVTNTLGWTQLKDETEADAVTIDDPRSPYGNGARAQYTSAGHTGMLTRSYFMFDTSSITDGATIFDASLHIRGYFSEVGDPIILFSEHGDTLGIDDWNNISWDYSWSDDDVAWDSSDWMEIDCVSKNYGNISDTGDTKLAMLNYDYDYLDSQPPDQIFYQAGCYYGDHVSAQPYLEITYSVAPVLDSFNIDPEGNYEWDLDNNDATFDWATTNVDSGETVTVYINFNKGSEASEPTTAVYDYKEATDDVTDNDCDWTSHIADWTTYDGVVHVKAIAHDGFFYSNNITDTLTDGIDFTVPVITDSQTGYDTRMDEVTDATFNVDFSDATSGLGFIQCRDSDDDEESDWHNINDSSIENDSSYTTNWQLPAAVWADLEEGQNDIYVRAKDSAGNDWVENATSPFYVWKDTVDPTLDTATFNEEDYNNNWYDQGEHSSANLTVTWTEADPDDVEIVVTGIGTYTDSSPSGGTSTFTIPITGKADGEYAIAITITDMYGHTDTTVSGTDHRNLKLDNTAPIISTGAWSDSSSNLHVRSGDLYFSDLMAGTDTATLSGTSTDGSGSGLDKVEFSTEASLASSPSDDDSPASWSGGYGVVTASTAANSPAQITIHDNVGNTVSETYDYIEDTTGPNQPTVTCYRDGWSDAGEWDNDIEIYVKWTGESDAGAGILDYYAEYNVATPTVATGGDSQEIINGAVGLLRTFYVRGRDNVGNWGTVGSDTINIDTTAPTLNSAIFSDDDYAPNWFDQGINTHATLVISWTEGNPKYLNITVSGIGSYNNSTLSGSSTTFDIPISGEADGTGYSITYIIKDEYGATDTTISGTDDSPIKLDNTGPVISTGSWSESSSYLHVRSDDLYFSDLMGGTDSATLSGTSTDGSGSGLDRVTFSSEASLASSPGNDNSPASWTGDYGIATASTAANSPARVTIYDNLDNSNYQDFIYIEDTTGPNTPTSVTCRPDGYGDTGEWDNELEVYVTWAGEVDSGAGIDDYYMEYGESEPIEEASGGDQQDTDDGVEGLLRTFYVRGLDNVGNWGSSSSDTINLDNTNPTVSIDNIDYLGEYPQSITGTASDGTAGIHNTTITIYDATDDDYWTGSAWGAEKDLTTSPDAYDGIWRNWSYSTSGIAWEYGDIYWINATSIDNVSRTSTQAQDIFKTPNILFTNEYPDNGDTDIMTMVKDLHCTITGHVSWNITLRDENYAIVQSSIASDTTDGIKWLNLSADPLDSRYNINHYLNVSATNGSVTLYQNTSFTTCDGLGFTLFDNITETVSTTPRFYQVYIHNKFKLFATAWDDGLHSYEIETDNTLDRIDQDRNLVGGQYSYYSIGGNDTYIVVGCLDDAGIHIYDNDISLNRRYSNLSGFSVYSIDMNETIIACAVGIDGFYILTTNGATTTIRDHTTLVDGADCRGIAIDETNNRIYVTTSDNGTAVYSYNPSTHAVALIDGWNTTANCESNKIIIDTDDNAIIPTVNGIMIFSCNGATLTRENVDTTYDNYDSGVVIDDKFIIGSHDDTAEISSTIYPGNLFAIKRTDNISDTNREYTNGVAVDEDDVYIVIANERYLQLYGFDLAPVVEPVIEVTIGGIPGADDPIYNNRTYNPETHCNITATIEVPEERYFGRYQYGSGDDTYVALGETSGIIGYDLSGTLMAACKFECTYTSVNYSTISAYVTFLGSDSANLSFAIYNDSNGAPHTKLKECDDTWRATKAAYRLNYDRWLYAAYWPDTSHRWATLDLTSNVTLYEGTTYWLVAACNDTYNDITGVGWPPANNSSYANDFHDYFCIQGNDDGATQNVIYTYYEVPADCTFPATWPTSSNHKGRPIDDVECTMEADYYYKAYGDWYKEDYNYQYVNEPQPDAFSPESYKPNWLVADALNERCIFNTTLIDKVEYSGKVINFVNITVCSTTENTGNKFTLGIRNTTINWGSEYTFAAIDTYYNVTSSWATNPWTASPWTWKDIENLSIVYNCSTYSTGDLSLNQIFINVNSDGDFIDQNVNTMCIYAADTKVADLPVTIDTAIVQWYNYSNTTWTDYPMTQIGATNNWTYDVTGLDGGNWYSFNISCTDNFGNVELYEHFRLLKEGVAERIKFQCGVTPDSSQLGYNSDTVLYFQNATYDDTPLIFGDSENMADNMNHEQGCDGSWHDTGYWSADFTVGDFVEARYCSFFTGGWLDTNTTFDGDGTWTWDNIYLHLWQAGGESYDATRMRWGRSDTAFNPGYIITNSLGEFDEYIITNNTARDAITLEEDDIYLEHNDWLGNTTFRLEAGLHQVSLVDDTFDSNSIYQIAIYFHYLGTDTFGAGGFTNTHMVSNRSHLSYAILNVPLNATLNAENGGAGRDSDSDGLNDTTELYVTWTHPFFNDTDNDGYLDNVDGSPNHYMYYTDRYPKINQSSVYPTDESGEQICTFTAKIWDEDNDALNVEWWWENETGVWHQFGSNASVDVTGILNQKEISYTDSNFTTDLFVYNWSINVSEVTPGIGFVSSNTIHWTNQTFQFRAEVDEVIQSDGIDYFVWLEASSAYHIAQEISGFNSNSEYIAIWDRASWDTDDWLWKKYYGDASGTNFTVSKYDVIIVSLEDSGTQTIYINVDFADDYSGDVNMTLANNASDGLGYNFNAVVKVGFDETLNSLNATVGLSWDWDVGWAEVVGVWNDTTEGSPKWDWWFAGWPYNVFNADIGPWCILQWKIADTVRYFDTDDF